MKNLLNEQSRQNTFTPGGIHGLYGTSFGAGMYGAFYSPRAQKHASSGKPKLERNLELTNDFLGDIKDDLAKTLKLVVQRVFKIEDKTAEIFNAKGNLNAADRDGVLKTIKEKPSYMQASEFKSAKRSDFLSGINKTLHTEMSTILADLILGAPKEGTARFKGREYKEALSQYTKDRMMLDSENLLKTHGSKANAEKAIANDFHMQQKTEREIRKVDVEINRRKKAGFTDEDINSKEGGHLLDKMNKLLDSYARYDPTHTGRKLEKPVNESVANSLDRVPVHDRFNANRTAVKDRPGMERVAHPQVFHVHPDRGRPMPPEEIIEPAKPTVVYDKNGKARDAKGRFIKMAPVGNDKYPITVPTPSTASDVSAKEKDEENAEYEKKLLEEQEKQTTILSKIEAALKITKSPGIPGKKDEAGFSFKDLFETIKGIGPMLTTVASTIASAIGSVWTALSTGFAALSPILTAVGAILLPLAAAAGLVLLGKHEKEKIEANPTAPEYKDNAYAMTIRGEATSVAQAGKVNQQKALRQLQPGVAKEMLNMTPGADGKIDGYTREQLQSMSEGKKTVLGPTPLEKKAQREAQAAKIKPVTPEKGAQVEQATSSNNDAKAEAKRAPITIVAPTTVNNSQTAATRAPIPQGAVRNDESTLGKYVSSRYS